MIGWHLATQDPSSSSHLPQVTEEARSGQGPRSFGEMKKLAFRERAESLVSNCQGWLGTAFDG